MYFYFFIVILCFGKHVSAQTETTTATYELKLPGSRPVKIIEGEPLWRDHATTTTHSSSQFHRSLDIYPTDETRIHFNSPEEDDNQESASEFQPSSLKQFLDSYADKLKKNNPSNHEDDDEEDDYENNTKETGNGDEKPKSWDLLNIQKHHHPYEDKSGWVSLEPIPWSVSKISKWQSNFKNKRPFTDYIEDNKPWDNRFNNHYEDQKPYYSQYQRPSGYDTDSVEIPFKSNNKIGIRDRNDVYYINRPNINPTFSKPSATYSQKVHMQTSSDYLKQPDRYHSNEKPFSHKNYNNFNNYNSYKHEENCNHHTGDIITDGMSPDFPSAPIEINRRRGTEMYPESHPFQGNGEWVLLSTTKGYKYSPSRQRSLKIDPDSIGAHRAVRLTVLPPSKNSKVNMTTSHGGLLQVESTFQTVEQAHREYTKKQKSKNKPKKRPQKVNKPHKQGNRPPNKTKRPVNISGNRLSNRPSKQVIPSAITSNRRHSSSPDSSAVLAAVGAGMIPATMAMLVPIALNGRRKREAFFGTESPPSNIEVTLTRNM